jgi:hypothetical protein
MGYVEDNLDSVPALKAQLHREIEARDNWMRKFHALEAQDRMPRIVATAVVLVVLTVFATIGICVWHSDVVDEHRVKACVQAGNQWKENVAGHYECVRF